MKRRTLLKMIAGATAFGMAPAFLNLTKLPKLVSRLVDDGYTFPVGDVVGNIWGAVIYNEEGVIGHIKLDSPVYLTDMDTLNVSFSRPEDCTNFRVATLDWDYSTKFLGDPS